MINIWEQTVIIILGLGELLHYPSRDKSTNHETFTHYYAAISDRVKKNKAFEVIF